MQAAGTLELIAEIAVAFAGFTGLVAVFRERRRNESAIEGRYLIEYSLTLLANALMPVVLWHLSGDESFAWRAASVGSIVGVLGYYWLRGHEAGAAAETLNLSTFLTRFVYVGDSLHVIALTVNALGLTPWPPSLLYLLALTYLLFMTCVSFLRFASPLWVDSSAE
jgi:hypothetical protein